MRSLTNLLIFSVFAHAIARTLSLSNDFVVRIPNEVATADPETENLHKSPGEVLVVGGVEAAKHEFPGIVNLMISKPGGTAFCGGNIINETWILTSAHCIWPFGDVSGITVTAGDHYRSINEGTEQARTVKQMYVPDTYDSFTSANDIALLELQTPFILNQYVGVSKLANPSYTAEGSPIVAGWGRNNGNGTVTDELRKANLTFVSNPECARAYGSISNADIRDSTVCASGIGIGPCNGDSGGPLMCHSATDGLFVCGISSFMVECGNPRWPSGFERISSHINWIGKYVSSIHIISPQVTTTTTPTTTVQSTGGSGTGALTSPSIGIVAIILLTKIRF